MPAVKKPVLSISMLISNGRTDTIKKCMESLRSLRKAVPSELILVDTGCMDGGIEVAREYTDQVLTFSWCNDFSAARNTGLSACSGEWFLYLDDDEWFEDTAELEQFFLSGEYKNYDGAWYLVRNYDNYEGTKYSDSFVGRMHRLTAASRFVGKIHEHIEPSPHKIKYFHAFVHHYGYVYQDEEERQRHILRNLSLEEAAVAEHPEDIRMCCQLIQEYRAAKRYDDAERLCRETLERKLYPESNSFMQFLLTCLPRIHAEQGKHREAIEEYSALERSGKLAQIEELLCKYEKLYLYAVLKEEDNHLLMAEEYLRTKDGMTEIKGYPVMDFAEYASDQMYQRVVGNGIKAMFRLKNYEKAQFFFERIDWTLGKDSSEAYIKLLLLAYQETGNPSLLTNAAEKIAQVPVLRESWLSELERFLNAYADLPEREKGKRLTKEEFQRKAKEYAGTAQTAPITVPVLRIWMKETEFFLLSEQMREIITAQIAAGNTAEAAGLLSEVEGMLPKEGWVQETRKILGRCSK